MPREFPSLLQESGLVNVDSHLQQENLQYETQQAYWPQETLWSALLAHRITWAELPPKNDFGSELSRS